MKLMIAAIGLLLFTNIQAQTNANMIVGKWIKTPKEDLIIEVYAEGNSYNGKIEWSKDSSKPAGFLILEQLSFDEESNSWENGKIYDPRSGNKYKAAAKLKEDGTLEVLGYKGFKMIGSKRVFKRVK